MERTYRRRGLRTPERKCCARHSTSVKLTRCIASDVLPSTLVIDKVASRLPISQPQVLLTDQLHRDKRCRPDNNISGRVNELR